jgi:alkyldihydroxyacetonephosphate synthase
MERVRARWNGWGSPGHEDALAANEPAWRWLAQAFAMPALLATPARELSSIVLPPSRLGDHARQRLALLLGSFGVAHDDFDRVRHVAGRGLIDLLRLRAGALSVLPDAVLYPRNEADVLAVLKLCGEIGIAVVPFGGGTGNIAPPRGAHGAVVALNLSDLNQVTFIDTISGLANVEAGITGPELERQLTSRGMMLGHRPDSFEFSSLGGWIAQPGAGQEAARSGGVADWLRGLRVATPRGLITPAGVPDLKQLMLGSQGAFGVITSATIRIRALPAKEDHRRYLFPDFASGLAAVREAQRSGLPHSLLRLSDDGQTRFSRALQRAGRDWNLAEHFRDIYLSVRRFDGQAAQLLMGFAGSDSEVTAARKRFDHLAKRLGALALGVDTEWRQQRFAAGYRRDTLLDRGVGMDSLEVSVSWAKLPSLYVAIRAALKQAMRNHVPRAGAHGLVLCHVGPARADGATMTFTWLFPRILEDEIAQAQNIRRAALAASATPDPDSEKLEREVLRGIKHALDPQNILNPGIL